MKASTVRRPSRGPAAPASLAEEIQALKGLTNAELQDRFAAVHGFESRSNNREYLWKRVAWRLQEMAEGGLSDEDRARAAALAQNGKLRARPPRGAVEAVVAAVAKHPLDDPFAWILVKPDGADTPMLGALQAASIDAVSTGARVKPVWAEEREGHIDDIAHWVLVEGGDA